MRTILTIAAIAARPEVGGDCESPTSPGAPDTADQLRRSQTVRGAPRSITPVPRLATWPYGGDAA